MTSTSSPSSKPLSSSELVVGGLALATTALTTWAFAGRASWAPQTFTTLSVLTALMAIVMARVESRPLRLKPFLPVLLFALLTVVSLVNPSYLPVAEHPGRWTANPDWIRWLPAAVDREITLQKALPWFSAFLLAAAIRQTEFSRRATRLLWASLLGHLVLVAIVGIYFHATDPYHTLGLIRDRHGYHFASFVYRNHWAAAVILLVPVALGFAFSALKRWTIDRGPFDAVLVGFGIALLLAITLPMPGSRSGIVVVGAMLVFSLLKFALGVLRHRRKPSARDRWMRFAAITAFALPILAGGYFLVRAPLEQHLLRTKQQLQGLASGQSDLRIRFTIDTVRMAADRPVWGWGVGSFGLVFPRYQGDYLRNKDGKITSRVMHAHNDWAQIAAETGVIGLALALTLVFTPIRAGWKSGSVLERWVTGGLIVLLLYALVDFPLHNPAVLFMAAVLLASIGRETRFVEQHRRLPLSGECPPSKTENSPGCNSGAEKFPRSGEYPA